MTSNSKEPHVYAFRDPAATASVKELGGLGYVHEYGDNDSAPTYQEASGAPVENISPLGLQVTWFTTIFLNVGQMIGTGVFSTRVSYFILNLYFIY